jgi:hypothetical protein
MAIFADQGVGENISFPDGHQLEQTGTNQEMEQLWSL